MSTNGIADRPIVAESTPVDDVLPPGTRVEVRRRFDQHWSRGFEIVERCETGYRLRRLSDGTVLPVEFAEADVRRERKKQTWWI
ncbi:MAG TPA: hypothetical protein VD926_00825 [Acidimicrobiales bacterium]|nr:hypothetical protein [Acidimicrobiales bacterium]